MARVTIRAALQADVDDLMAIEVDADQLYLDSVHPALAVGSGIPRAVLEREIGRDRITVAEDASRVVGWVLLTRSAGELCLGQISVRRDVGHAGVGTQLLTHVIATARANGEKSIVLNTQSDVPWNQPWYARHRFVVVDAPDWTDDMHVIAREQSDAGLDWSSRVHMRLTLQ